MKSFHTTSTFSGKITQGITLGFLTEQTLTYVYQCLPKWRDNPKEPPTGNEENFNENFCSFLMAQSTHLHSMIFFYPEPREDSPYRVDISAKPKAICHIVGGSFTFNTPFLVIEAKRLPPPDKGKQRKKEYVTSGSEDKVCGGIQRFKLSRHGTKLKLAGMIGYIEKHDSTYWHGQINHWINELHGKPQEHGESWSSSEQLETLIIDAKKRTAQTRSYHSRIGEAVSSEIELRHFFVEMN